MANSWGIWHRGRKKWIVRPFVWTKREADKYLTSLTARRRDQHTRYTRLCAIVCKESEVEAVQAEWESRGL